MNDPLREALRRNALLSAVLGEGYRPEEDAALRARVRDAMRRAVRRRRVRRSLVVAASAAALLLALATFPRAPIPKLPVAASRIVTGPESFLIVTTAAAAPAFEIVPKSSISTLEVVRTGQVIGPLDHARDEDLLASGEVLGLVGYPGGLRRVILVSPTPRRNLE